MTRSTDDLGCKARCAVSGADIADGATRGGTDDFILIPDVQVLMRMLPQPLGFARNAFGEPEISRKERAVNKLLWAELNLIAVERRLTEPDSRIWRWVTAMMGLRRPTPKATNYVTFEETFITLLHWRCPQYVPQDIKDARAPMMEDIVMTAHAVVISRHIRRWLEFAAFRGSGGQTPGRPSSAPGTDDAPSLLGSISSKPHSSLKPQRQGSGSRHGFFSAVTHEIRELGHAVAQVPRQGSNQRLYRGLQKATENKMSTAVGGLDARFARAARGEEESHGSHGQTESYEPRRAASDAHQGSDVRTRRASDAHQGSDVRTRRASDAYQGSDVRRGSEARRGSARRASDASLGH